MVCEISGKPTGTKIPHLHVNHSEVTDIPDIANSLAQTFSDNSSYSAKFQSFRRQAENNPLNFKSNNTETYNNPFSVSELTAAISKSHHTADGPDDIHYQMLKHLPASLWILCYTSQTTSGLVAISHQAGELLQ